MKNNKIQEIIKDIKYVMFCEKAQGKLSKPFEKFLNTKLGQLEPQKNKEHPRVCPACQKRAGYRGRRGICPESHFDRGERRGITCNERAK